MKVEIGQNLKLDVMRLVESRLLVQASSGGGKSMTLRTILESTFGQVPHIILDVEGEFSTLREKYDYILAGKGGDIPADPRTAQLLAKKMLELNASIIIDLYELKHSDKHRFVRLFLESLIDAPKELWGPRLVVVDEAHQFCPEKGAGTSEAWEVVIDMCEKGRKRGLGAVLATQRLSKLNKDAAAECQNKIIGLGNLDVDRERSAKELGFTHKEDILSLRDLEAGEFYCIGPALCRHVTKTRINLAETSHPKIGKRTLKAPVATKRVLHLLEKIKDLPQEAEKELKTVNDLHAEIQRLKQELRKVPVQVAEKADLKGIEDRLRKELARAFDASVRQWIKHTLSAIKTSVSASFENDWVPPMPIETVVKPVPVFLKPPEPIQRVARPVLEVGEKKIGHRQREILRYLCLFPEKKFRLASMALMIGAPNNGTFSNLCSDLAVRGLITRAEGKLQISAYDEAVSILGPDFRPRTGTLAEFWANKLKGRPRMIYDTLLGNPSTAFRLADLAEAIGSPNNGTFSNLCSALSVQGVAIRENGSMKLNPEILELG